MEKASESLLPDEPFSELRPRGGTMIKAAMQSRHFASNAELGSALDGGWSKPRWFVPMAGLRHVALPLSANIRLIPLLRKSVLASE